MVLFSNIYGKILNYPSYVDTLNIEFQLDFYAKIGN